LGIQIRIQESHNGVQKGNNLRLQVEQSIHQFEGLMVLTGAHESFIFVFQAISQQILKKSKKFFFLFEHKKDLDRSPDTGTNPDPKHFWKPPLNSLEGSVKTSDKFLSLGRYLKG